MPTKTPITLPEDFFTKYDWDSQDLDVLGNNTKLIQEAAAAVAELGDTVQAQGEALEVEVKARTEGDANLQTEIDATDAAADLLTMKVNEEIASRESADAALGERIDAEASARTTADAEIRESIDKLTADAASEATERKGADETLQANIDKVASDLATETANRTDADATLTQSVSDVDARVAKLEENVIWRGSYTFANVPAGATQTYAFQLDVTYADATEVAPYVITTSPWCMPYVVLVAENALTVGVRNVGESDQEAVTVYAQAVGKAAS